jgi:hypothetical protein
MNMKGTLRHVTFWVVSTLPPPYYLLLVYCFWNMMAHAQKPNFVFRRRRVHLNRRGRQFSWLLVARGVRISGNNAVYTMFRGSVKGIGHPLHSPVSPSLVLPSVTVCHHISIGLCYRGGTHYNVCCGVNSLSLSPSLPPPTSLPSLTLSQSPHIKKLIFWSRKSIILC